MRTFENPLLPVDDWYVTSTLELDDDGRFRYHESWACYAGSTDMTAEGVWRQTEDAVMLETERLDGSPLLDLKVGRTFRAFDRGDRLDFGGGFTMTLRRSRERQ